MVYILLVIGIIAAEHKIKDYMDKKYSSGQSKEILGGKVTLNKQYNKGMFLNFLQNKAKMVKKLSALVLAIFIVCFALVIPKKGNALLKLGMSLILGGACSNIFDRWYRGHVVDYFSINIKPIKRIVFNLADIFIFLGTAIVYVISLFGKK